MSEHYRALLIGVWEYKKPGLLPLLGPQNDVPKMAHLLGESPHSLFETESLPNPGHELDANVNSFLREGCAGHHLLLYYSGHGVLGDDGRSLFLTNPESDPENEGSMLRFADLTHWVNQSPARSVLVILDCCRGAAGMADGRVDEFFATQAKTSGVSTPLVASSAGSPGTIPEPVADTGVRPTSANKAVNYLAAVTAAARALDAEKEDGLSPFTEIFCTAVASVVSDPEPVSQRPLQEKITLREVDTRMRSLPGTDRIPAIWGTHADVFVAARPAYVVQELRRQGLEPSDMRRAGAAVLPDGAPLVVASDQADRLVDLLRAGEHAYGVLAGLPGSGKSWALCEVHDRLIDDGWHVRSLAACREDPDPSGLVDALTRWVRHTHPGDGKFAVLVDGVEWSTGWGDVLQRLEPWRLDASIVVAIDSHQESDWHVIGAIPVPSLSRTTGTGRFAERLLTAVDRHQGRDLSHNLEQRSRRLAQMAGASAWTLAHLALADSLTDSVAQLRQDCWTRHLSDADDADLPPLRRLAALSHYGAGCPTSLAPRLELLAGLGAEVLDEGNSVRLNGSFICQTILARQKRGDKDCYDMRVENIDQQARRGLRSHLAGLLGTPGEEHQILRLVRRLKRDQSGAPVSCGVSVLAVGGGVGLAAGCVRVAGAALV